tara:strand:- start:266 stop:424 length:159 start_codon:yes stop_codon:yes gene_type:complete
VKITIELDAKEYNELKNYNNDRGEQTASSDIVRNRRGLTFIPVDEKVYKGLK